ncbi:MAG: nucleoside 2-deoxyribosyltransferase [Candidatus Komeilibacteria bacterium]
MKIYFAGSIRGSRADQSLYRDIITLLQPYGQVLTEHLGNQDLSSYGEIHLSDQEICQRDVSWVTDSDIIIAEVTQNSVGVGYELGLAEGLKKRVVCLYRPQPEKLLSSMIAGNKNFTVIEYQTLEKLKPKLEQIFKQP